MRYGAIVTRPAAVTTPATARFYSDPGVGNFYLGMNNPAWSTVATHETKMGAPLTMLRTFGASAPNWSSIDTIIAGGRIPWTSWKEGTLTNANIAAGLEDATLHQWATEFKARAPWPVWWTYHHEPENDANTQGATNTKAYRDAQRRIKQIFRADGVTNDVFVCVNYMCPYTWQSSSGRDWRTWYPDWRNATGLGTPLAPDPNDFYKKGDPSSVVDVIGLDFYHSWEIQDNPPSSMTKFGNITGPNVWSSYLSPATGFLNQPYAVGEWSTAAAQDGLVFDPNGDGSYTLTEYNAQVTAGTITHYPAQTDAWIDDYFGNRTNRFAAFCYWDASSTKTTAQVATNPLDRCDPAETRWKRIGVWGSSASAKAWTG